MTFRSKFQGLGPLPMPANNSRAAFSRHNEMWAVQEVARFLKTPVRALRKDLPDMIAQGFPEPCTGSKGCERWLSGDLRYWLDTQKQNERVRRTQMRAEAAALRKVDAAGSTTRPRRQTALSPSGMSLREQDHGSMLGGNREE